MLSTNACKMSCMTMNEINKIHEISARRIAQLLYETGWNKSELSRRLGISVQAVQQWASGKSRPSGANLTKLSELSGKPEHWFFQTEEQPTPVSQPVSEKFNDNLNGLREDQKSLLAVYEALPPAERRNMIAAFEMRLQELNNFYERYVKNISLKDK